MVAAMPLTAETTNNRFDLTTIALGLAAVMALVLVAGSLNEAPVAVNELDEASSQRFITIDSGQSANVAENSAASTTALTVSITNGPATGCSIASGNADQDGDGNDPWSISSTCVISVNDAGDLDYETYDTSYTLTLLANDGNGNSDVETVSLSITDVNDNAPTDMALSASSAAEDASAGTAIGTLSTTEQTQLESIRSRTHS